MDTFNDSGEHVSGNFFIEKFNKPDWAWIILFFVEDISKKTAEFKIARDSIIAEYSDYVRFKFPGSNMESQTGLWVKNYLKVILYEFIEAGIEEDSISKHALRFREEIDGMPYHFKFISHIDGLSLESVSVDVSEGIKLRKPIKSDLETETDELDGRSFILFPSAILEVEFDCLDEKLAFAHLENVFLSLRLFRLGTIIPLKTASQMNTVMWPHRNGGGPALRSPVIRSYRLMSEHESSLKTFIPSMLEALQSLNVSGDNHRSIALKRYDSALTDHIDTEKRLTTSISGLEALLTSKKDTSKSKALGSRLSIIFSTISIDSIDVQNRVTEAYRFRNNILHGSPVTLDERRRMAELLPMILDYLRITIIICLFDQATSKSDFLDMMDEALDSNQGNSELSIRLNAALGGHPPFYEQASFSS